MAEVAAALEQTVIRSSDQHPSIAVLPFANMSRDPDDEYFSDGLAEEIINLLANVPDLKVTARTSSFAFRGKEQDIRQIGEALGVRTILEGSVRRAGSRIRVTAQLINTDDGYHLWSERYDRELTDVFAIQDDIAQAIAGALQTTLVSRPRQAHAELPAYEALLKARHQVRTYAPEAHARASEYCEQAIALDPQYAAPYALLASLISTRRRTPADRCRRSRPRFAEPPRARSNSTRSKPNRIFCSGQSRLRTTTTGPKRHVNSRSALASPSAPAEAHWSRCVLL